MSADSTTKTTETTVSDSSALSGYSAGLSIDEADAPPPSERDTRASTRSANTSVYNFVEEFGRTFHRYKEGKYYLPNDEQEQNRLDLQHAIATHVLGGKLGIAPVGETTRRVLDVGTGTGIWAIAFAEQYPGADVVGTDLSPIQPEYVPANCRFEIDDADDEWTWRQPFDYVHCRYVLPFFRDVPGMIGQAFASLAPGGHLEFFEGPMVFQAVGGDLAGSVLQTWAEHMATGVRRIGRDPMGALRMREWMAAAGFVDIEERRLALPIGTWPKGRANKVLGAMEQTNLLEVAHGITSTVFTKALGWSVAEVDAFLERVRDDLHNPGLHAYMPVIAICGRKPAEA